MKKLAIETPSFLQQLCDQFIYPIKNRYNNMSLYFSKIIKKILFLLYFNKKL